MNKKELIAIIHHAGNMSIGHGSVAINATNNLLILLTAAGQITGTLLQRKSESDLKETITDAVFLNAAKVISAQSTDDSLILLKDAILKTAGGDMLLYRYLYVFADDIIAATIGNSDVK